MVVESFTGADHDFQKLYSDMIMHIGDHVHNVVIDVRAPFAGPGLKCKTFYDSLAKH